MAGTKCDSSMHALKKSSKTTVVFLNSGIAFIAETECESKLTVQSESLTDTFI